ncbi:hypothetical protein KY285_002901 [Solanum tuberosum]|nr:hypothetical protein KY285_002901 [Solanum tuberosum]
MMKPHHQLGMEPPELVKPHYQREMEMEPRELVVMVFLGNDAIIQLKVHDEATIGAKLKSKKYQTTPCNFLFLVPLQLQ